MGILMVPRADVNLMSRHVPPSRIRYEKKNPKVSVRLTESVRKILDDLREKQKKQKRKLSYADLVKKGLTACAEESAAYQKGYSKASEEFKIWYYCSVCGKRMIISPNSESHKAVIKHLKEAGWGHTECHQKKPGSEATSDAS